MHLEGEGPQGLTIPTSDPSNQTAFPARAIVNCNITAFYGCFSSRVSTGLPSSEDREERLLGVRQGSRPGFQRGGMTNPDIELTEEPFAVLSVALKVVAREELVGSEREADIGRLGDIESRQGQLRRLAKRIRRCISRAAEQAVPRTFSFLASRHTSSLNLNKQVRASWRTATPSSFSVKLRTTILLNRMRLWLMEFSATRSERKRLWDLQIWAAERSGKHDVEVLMEGTIKITSHRQ